MPLSPQELARRRVANRAAHYAAKAVRAATPMERAVAAWDQWRGLVRELPDQRADQWAEAIAGALEAHIAQLTKGDTQ